MLKKYLFIFFLSMVPVIELRGAIPFAVNWELDYWTALAVCAIGNMLPVPFIYFFARKILHWGADKKYIGKFFTYCIEKGEAGGKKLRAKAGRGGLFFALMLFVGIVSAAHAQQEAASITEWDGSNKRLRMRADSLITFSYKATANGTLYIYSDNQAVTDNVHVSIWGGWYHDGAYDADSPLQEAGSYENGVGVYGWIKVFTGDEVRFTLATPKEAEGVMAMFTLKSAFFGEDIKGDTWEQPIALVQNSKTTLPVYKNYDTDYLGDLS